MEVKFRSGVSEESGFYVNTAGAGRLVADVFSVRQTFLPSNLDTLSMTPESSDANWGNWTCCGITAPSHSCAQCVWSYGAEIYLTSA